MHTDIQSFMKSNDELRWLIETMPQDVIENLIMKNYKPGQIILKKDDVIHFVHIQLKGSVNVISEFEDGHIYIFSKNPPFNLISEVAVLAGEECASCTVEAAEVCKTIQMTKQDFIRWVENNSDISFWIAKQLAKKIYPLSQTRGSRFFNPAITTLKSFIVREIDRTMKKNTIGIIKKTRIQMADELGLSIRTINRNIKFLKEKDYVTTVKGKISLTKDQLEKLRHADIDSFS